MLKSIFVGLTGLLALAPLPANAIAPGVQQADYCANYTMDRFRLTSNEVKITGFQQRGSNYRVTWTIPDYRGQGYCIVSKSNRMVDYRVERQPNFNLGGGGLGPNEKRFYNLPGYGNVVVNRGQGAVGDKQYFLLRPINSNRNYKWYARCASNSDQVYDHRGKYVGNTKGLTVMFPYVCEVSPLSQNKPTMKPQPR
ncbi:MAG: hypothetical protein VKJ02_01535 [Snowella sp.]|nr:hypothetical protein [Snowella sp.]